MIACGYQDYLVHTRLSTPGVLAAAQRVLIGILRACGTTTRARRLISPFLSFVFILRRAQFLFILPSSLAAGLSCDRAIMDRYTVHLNASVLIHMYSSGEDKANIVSGLIFDR